ncbi:MAG: histidine ammonia-lyase [Chitinophagales bacterium]|jgi:histidine ammonia-lyase|nr:histidine ammonia-lyase [Chitinophagales bacterium]MCO5281402.1 histidine ammonia-lyase [Chitinophagales bacterium]OJV25988.1 MAG: histidine ammonia-lyase [Bacteroidetes bacterium 37-13]HRN93145.1 histidine ammonia-lyase [Chitinophagales bacterium]HRP38328.1 histidine ammonia-lyase [Chitinophagales bacterium]
MEINNNQLSLKDLKSFLIASTNTLSISKERLQAVAVNRSFLEKKLEDKSVKYYGINTGFGALYDVTISDNELEQLQQNLVMSHACGMGDEVRSEVVKLMMLLKVKGLSLGYSGVCADVINLLIAMYNNDILPVIWEVGSLGASGDLAPLAHLSLPLLGLGTVRYKGEKMDAAQALKLAGLSPIKLKAKEGLALLNGTQFMSAWGCFSLIESERVELLADLTAAISVDAFNASLAPFHPAIQRVRNHKGQIESAQNVLKFLRGSEISSQRKEHLQDPYSFRCVPQVHGAVKFAISQVKEVFEREINAVTDNPLVFHDEDLIISGGNFHGEPLAIALDYLSIAMSELASISERRTFQLISGKRNLPKFLVAKSGLNSGLMIPQYTAASIVSMNKQLATPASVDTITSSDGQEDHVSMGANAAVKCYKIVYNIEKVLAIEFMTAMQALEFRTPLKSSPFIEKVKEDYRKIVSPLSEDRILYNDIQITVDFMRTIKL